MSFRRPVILAMLVAASHAALADETYYRYEGNVSVCDESTGWICGNPCEYPCSDSVEEGHYVLRFAGGGDLANYALLVPGDLDPPPPPPTLWVEWRFRSNHPIGPNFFGCDAHFVVDFEQIHDAVNMYGDATISFDGSDSVFGLDIDEFHTFRFESLDGANYRISVDGKVFIDRWDFHTPGGSFLQMGGRGGCDSFPDTVNEWDFVRYGTVSSGEQIIASDPPGGPVELAVGSTLDRFTVTFDSPNYVYLDEITVETTGADPPKVIQTRRRENDEPHTVEIVLDRPMPLGRTTRFTFDDGVAVNVVEYTVTELVPAVSQWGLVVLALLTLIAGAILCRPRRIAA